MYKSDKKKIIDSESQRPGCFFWLNYGPVLCKEIYEGGIGSFQRRVFQVGVAEQCGHSPSGSIYSAALRHDLRVIICSSWNIVWSKQLFNWHVILFKSGCYNIPSIFLSRLMLVEYHHWTADISTINPLIVLWNQQATYLLGPTSSLLRSHVIWSHQLIIPATNTWITHKSGVWRSHFYVVLLDGKFQSMRSINTWWLVSKTGNTTNPAYEMGYEMAYFPLQGGAPLLCWFPNPLNTRVPVAINPSCSMLL